MIKKLFYILLVLSCSLSGEIIADWNFGVNRKNQDAVSSLPVELRNGATWVEESNIAYVDIIDKRSTARLNTNQLDDALQNFTLEAWIYSNEWGSLKDWTEIISKKFSKIIKTEQDSENRNEIRLGFELNISIDDKSENQKLGFVIYRKTEDRIPNWHAETAKADLPNSTQWTHIVVVVKPTSIEIYLNGELSGQSIFQTFNWDPAKEAPLMINASKSFTGKIGKVSIYNNALNEQQIKNFYHQEKATYN